MGPARHEAGSPNVLGAVALAVACEVVDEHREAIAELDETLGRGLVSRLDAIPGCRRTRSSGRLTTGRRSSPSPSRAARPRRSRAVSPTSTASGARRTLLRPRPRRCPPRAAGVGQHERGPREPGSGELPEHVDRLVAAVRSLAPRADSPSPASGYHPVGGVITPRTEG
ncbi:hypothetical protein [Janibacter melonis]|uniref:hypothetical protein n=1 Tax=Janibacter melonis TaxID=262209 RepID=UPI0020944AAD|nr:hypothetical protein [Janibacter melonis]